MNNIANIIRYDPNLKAIVYNEFKSAIDVIGELPWKQVKQDGPMLMLPMPKCILNGYMKSGYTLQNLKTHFLRLFQQNALYHPIKEYFATLQWDGVERLDTLLVDYMGADDSPYVRAVTRKALTAAVARIYAGNKFDSMLVISESRNG